MTLPVTCPGFTVRFGRTSPRAGETGRAAGACPVRPFSRGTDTPANADTSSVQRGWNGWHL
jgi:hypothetical protein